MTDYRTYTLIGACSQMRVAKRGGRDHMVVPVVALVADAVINPLGSRGPEMVPGDVLARSVAGWNGRPVLSDHPISDDGRVLSANDPTILDRMEWGTVFHSAYRDGRLVVEAWIDPDKAEAVGASPYLEKLQTGEMVEVSVGARVVVEDEPGTINDHAYTSVWRDIQPDHLAIGLGGAKGACSVAMGCGAMRAARYRITDGGMMPDTTPAEPAPGLFRRLRDALTSLVGAAEGAITILENDSEPTSEDRAACSCDNSGTKGASMAKATPERVKSLIDNPRSPFDQADEGTLLAMSDEDLSRWESRIAEPAAVSTPEPATATATAMPIPVAAIPPAVEAIAAMGITPEDVLKWRAAAAREEVRAAVRKTELVSELRSLQQVYDEAKLNAMTIEQLEDIVKLVGHAPPIDYSLRGAMTDTGKPGSFDPPDPYKIAGKAN